MTRVLLVDDQLLVRTGFRVILDAQPDIEVVGEAGDGLEAITACTELAPDVVCMDVQMPGLDGLEATRRITSGPEAPAVLVLTTFDPDDSLFRGVGSGAGPPAGSADAPPPKRSTPRRVAGGKSGAPPAASTRTASTSCSGLAVLSRNPDAPDSSARNR